MSERDREDNEWYSDFGPEADPVEVEGSFVTTAGDKKHLASYQESGRIVNPGVLMEGTRSSLLGALDRCISPDEQAEKFKELLNATNHVKDDEGNILASKPDYKTQMKALDLLTEVQGTKAPKKSIGVKANASFEEFMGASNKKSGADYAKRKLSESASGGAIGPGSEDPD